MRTLPARRPHHAPPRARAAITFSLAVLAPAAMVPFVAELAAQEATAGLRAVVTASATGEPIAGATVRVGGAAGKVGVSDSEGRVRIGGIAPGARAVVVEAPGYVAAQALITFEALRIADAAFSLDAEPIPLEPIGVTVEGRSAKLEMVGFYERSELRTGTFLPPDEVRERAERAFQLSEMLRGLGRIRIVPASGGEYAVETRRGAASMSLPCHPRIWLDGVRLHAAASAKINRIVSPSQIAAIEVYGGPSETPVEFDVTGSACGAILIWTGARPR